MKVLSFLTGGAGLILSAWLSLASALAQTSEVEEAPDFATWLAELRTEALGRGLSQATVDAALDGVAPDPRVIEHDRKQPEFTQTFQDYVTARVSEARIKAGREKVSENIRLLDQVTREHGVPQRIVAAIWGMETNYGRFMGSYSVVPSLVTLAHDRRRSTYFRSELLNALQVLDEGHIGVTEMKGSWAGAMGQGQFMPSAFLRFAQDFNGDGRKDIWADTGDVFASIANYLKSHGWKDRQRWGRAVALPAGFVPAEKGLSLPEPPRECARALKDHTRMLPLAEWRALGLKLADGRDLPVTADMKASLVQPAGVEGPAFLAYENFRAILRYNCSNYYAIAVGSLADLL